MLAYHKAVIVFNREFCVETCNMQLIKYNFFLVEFAFTWIVEPTFKTIGNSFLIYLSEINHTCVIFKMLCNGKYLTGCQN